VELGDGEGLFGQEAGQVPGHGLVYPVGHDRLLTVPGLEEVGEVVVLLGGAGDQAGQVGRLAGDGVDGLAERESLEVGEHPQERAVGDGFLGGQEAEVLVEVDVAAGEGAKDGRGDAVGDLLGSATAGALL
jgi:hypothetical protein